MPAHLGGFAVSSRGFSIGETLQERRNKKGGYDERCTRYDFWFLVCAPAHFVFLQTYRVKAEYECGQFFCARRRAFAGESLSANSLFSLSLTFCASLCFRPKRKKNEHACDRQTKPTILFDIEIQVGSLLIVEGNKACRSVDIDLEKKLSRCPPRRHAGPTKKIGA